MKSIAIYLTLFVVVILCAFTNAKTFEDIAFYTNFEQAKEVAAQTNTNLLVLFTKTTCPACINLKKSFSQDTDKFEEAVKDRFTLVHLKDGDVPPTGNWSPDGSYIPRVVFATAEGTPLPITHMNRHQYQYFYHDVDSLVLGINNAANKISASGN